jgi:hypothetical protein
MVFGIDDAIAVAGVGASLFGGKKSSKGGQPIDPYKFFPEAREAWNEDIIPDARSAYRQPFQPIETRRYDRDPATDRNASRSLFALQRLRDSRPFAPPAQEQQQEIPAEALAALRDEILGRQAFASLGNSWTNGQPKYRMTGSMPPLRTNEDYSLFGRMYGDNADPTRWAKPDWNAGLTKGVDRGKVTPSFASRFSW